MMVPTLIIHTDGGSRGNPGEAASACIVEKDSQVIFSKSKYLGITTNNIAEYTGVLIAMEWLVDHCSEFVGFTIVFVLDSELIVKQINKVYKVKDLKLKALHKEVVNLIYKTGLRISFQNVPRSKNKEADKLVNIELDKKLKAIR